MEQSKTCTKCKQIYPATPEFYHRHKGSSDGLAQRCKACRIEDNSAYKAANPEKYRQSNKDYHNKNRQTRNAIRAARYWQDVELSRQKNRDKYPVTAEQQKENSRNWRKNNPEKRREQERRRRAQERNVIHEPYSNQDILDRWGTDCHYCNLPIDLEANRQPGAKGWQKSLHLDHVIPIKHGGPDTVENVKPAHGLCNLRKLNLR